MRPKGVGRGHARPNARAAVGGIRVGNGGDVAWADLQLLDDDPTQGLHRLAQPEHGIRLLMMKGSRAVCNALAA
jgi:hypothetical protein